MCQTPADAVGAQSVAIAVVTSICLAALMGGGVGAAAGRPGAPPACLQIANSVRVALMQ